MMTDSPDPREPMPIGPASVTVPRVRIGVNRARWRPRLRWALSAGLAVLLINSLIGDAGYVAALRARQDERQLHARLNAIRHENHQLQNEGEGLRTNPAVLEEAARRQGLLRPGEVMVVLHDIGPDRRGGSAHPDSSAIPGP